MEAYIGPAITLAITFVAAAVGWGRVTQRLDAIEKRADKLETDNSLMANQLSDIKIKLAELNSKIDFLVEAYRKDH